MLMLLSLWAALSYVRESQGEEELRARNEYPIEFPIRVLGGQYTPGEALEAKDQIIESIVEATLNPDTSRAHVDRILAVSPTAYRMEGTVSAINAFGTRVKAGFAIEVAKSTRAESAGSGSGRHLEGIVEWEPYAADLEDLGQASPWKGSGMQSRPKPSAKSAPLESASTDAKSLYEVDADGYRWYRNRPPH
ncbi:MAG: hypothetical protein M9921_13100 [Fimbriimonadaceae bacterium]|nr:hypothetical protein [Fimbriimonadaceae bacterium]